MGIGDNFDTSSGGLKNQKTGRYSGKVAGASFYEDGSHEQDILNYYYNGGHPCNVGCGCHDVCEGFASVGTEATPCYLPEELLISVVQDETSRSNARVVIGSDQQDKDTFFLRYHNGAWRGRKCCNTGWPDEENGMSTGCGPCDLTTIEDTSPTDIYTWGETRGSCIFIPTGTPIPESGTTYSASTRTECQDLQRNMEIGGQAFSFLMDACATLLSAGIGKYAGKGLELALKTTGVAFDFNFCVEAMQKYMEVTSPEAAKHASARDWYNMRNTGKQLFRWVAETYVDGYDVKRSQCNYSGTKGIYDPIDSRVMSPDGRRLNQHEIAEEFGAHSGAISWLHDARSHDDHGVQFGNCLRDGEVAPRLPGQCLDKDGNTHTCGGLCFDWDSFVVDGFNDETNCVSAGDCRAPNGYILPNIHNDADCQADDPDNTFRNYEWHETDCTEKQCHEAGACSEQLDGNGDEIPLHSDCDDICEASTDQVSCLGVDGCKWNSNTSTCYGEGRDFGELQCMACGGDWYPKWVDSGYNATACCSGAVNSDDGPNHQPDLTGPPQMNAGGPILTKERLQGTCVSPYREAILVPGAQNIASGGATLGAPTPCASIQNANQRPLLASDPLYGGNYFTLILRGCDYYGDCSSRPKSGCQKQTVPPQSSDHSEKENCEADYVCIDENNNDITSTAGVCSDENFLTREDCEAEAGAVWTPECEDPNQLINSVWEPELSDLSHKYGAPGLETVLFIPVDQMLNCSNFDLTVKTPIGGAKGSEDGKWGQARWLDSRGDIDGNPAGFYPGTYNYADARYKSWCDLYDWTLDGVADYDAWCGKFVYYESGYTTGFSRLQNPNGHYKLRALNIHPQPFKATEQEQKKHKTYDEAVADVEKFSACIDSGVGYWRCYDGCIAEGDTHENCDQDCGAGMGGSFCNWDMAQGYDFWFKNDFAYTAADDIHAAGGPCRTIGRQVLDWTNGHWGETQCGGRCNGSGMPGEIGPNWKTWFPCEDPECMEVDAMQQPILVVPSVCEGRGKCLSFDPATNTGGKCSDPTYTNKEECEDNGGYWSPDSPVITGTNNGREACEASGGYWLGCGWGKSDFGCQPTECVDVDGNPQPYDNEADCLAAWFTWNSLNLPGSNCPCESNKTPGECNSEQCKWDINTGGYCRTTSDQTTTHHSEADCVAPDLEWIQGSCQELGMCGSDNCSDCKDTVLISSELRDLVYGYSHSGTKLIQPNSAGDSLDYWGRTGLYPNNNEEGISYVADSCVGTTRSGRVEIASNTSPVIIKSRNHLLKNGDQIEINGVLGNFRANRMTHREWNETVWEDKDGGKCKGEHCDDQVWPEAKCPPEDDGTCNHQVTFSDGTSIDTCYSGKDDKGNPLPAPWVVVEKYDENYFKLFTCDGEPLDGKVTTTGFSSCNLIDGTKKVCGSTIATHNGLRPKCPCQTVTGTGTSTVVTSSPEVPLEDEASCLTYGGCSIFGGGNPPGTQPEAIMTLADCNKLAQIYVSYDPDNGHQYADADTGQIAPCAEIDIFGQIDGSGCWNQLAWDNPGKFQVGEVGDPETGSSGVEAYSVCPYTGMWYMSPEVQNSTPYDHNSNDYRDGWDGTGVARLDLPNMSDNYYVQIEQKENCPVCADHFMPTDLVATVYPQDTDIFRLLKSGYSRCNRDYTDQGGWSGQLKPYADGKTCSVIQNTSCGKTYPACWEDCMETDPDTLPSGMCLTEHCNKQCCDDCALHPVRAFKPTEGPFLPDGSPNTNVGKLKDTCCNCECTSMDDNVYGRMCDAGCPENPTIDEFIEKCGGCGTDGSWVCHPNGCDHMKCRMVADVYMCSYTGTNGSSQEAIDCMGGMAMAFDTDGDGVPDTCLLNGATPINDCEPQPMGGHCECEPCTGYPKGRDDLCEGDFIGCNDQVSAMGGYGAWCDDACKNGSGYFKDGQWGRDNKLGSECAANDIAECYVAKGCKWEPDNVTDPSGPGTCKANNCNGGAEFPPSTASGITCYETEYDVRHGCPGLESPIDIPLVFNGGYWASDWLFMGNPEIIDGGNYELDAFGVRYVGGMSSKGSTYWGYSCSHHDWKPCCLPEGKCIDDCGGLRLPPNNMIEYKQWCNEQAYTWKPERTVRTCYECDCGSCDTMNDLRDFEVGASTPPLPKPAQDAHWLRMNLACDNDAGVPGDGTAIDGNARFNLTGDYYHNHQLGLSWEITTCSFPTCGSEFYKPPCPLETIEGDPPEKSYEDWDFGCYGCSAVNNCVNKHGGCGETKCGNCSSTPTLDCNGTPPCISCCTINTDGYSTCPNLGVPPHRSDTFPVCFGKGQSLDDMLPDWWYSGEKMTVYHVDMDGEYWEAKSAGGEWKRERGYDILTVRTSNAKCCAGGPPDWPAGYCSDENFTTKDQCEDGGALWHPTKVTTGRANRVEAELGNLGDYPRNNTSKNPDMGLGHTILSEDIPMGGERHHSGFIAIHVEDATVLRTGNAALDRKLQRRRTNKNNVWMKDVFSDKRFRYMDGGFFREEPSPYGLNPWPVAHQSPNGIRNRLESLREPFKTDLWVTGYIAPGRIGLIPNAQTMQEIADEALASQIPSEDPPQDDSGGGQSDDGSSGIVAGTENIPEIPETVVTGQVPEASRMYGGDSLEHLYKRRLAISSIENEYDPAGDNFLHTLFTTTHPHDLEDGEKIVISGAVTYEAECVDQEDEEAPPGECVSIDGTGKVKGPVIQGVTKLECESEFCIVNGSRDDTVTDKTDCEGMGGKWCGPRGEWDSRLPEGTKVDEHTCENDYQGKFITKKKWYEFNEGCSAHCRLSKFTDTSGLNCTAMGGGNGGHCQETLFIDKGEGNDPEYKIAESIFDNEHVVKVHSSTTFSIHYESTIHFEDLENTQRTPYAISGSTAAKTPYDPTVGTGVGSAHRKYVETFDPMLDENYKTCQEYNDLNCDVQKTEEDCKDAGKVHGLDGCAWDQSSSTCSRIESVCADNELCYISTGQTTSGDCFGRPPQVTTKSNGAFEENIVAREKGHEIGIGPAKDLYKDIIYNKNVSGRHIYSKIDNDCEALTDIQGNNLSCPESYNKFSDNENEAIWSRHGGLFDITVGSKEPMNNAHQMNSTTPVNLTYYVTAHEACCNIFQPPVLYDCYDGCYEGYGPWRGLPFEEEGSVFKITVTEAQE